jgi:hypothetical protein
MDTTTAIWQAIVQCKEAWTELLLLVVFFGGLHLIVRWQTNRDIKRLNAE